MKVSYNWLKQYVELGLTPPALAELLTDAGVAVDAVVELNQGLSGAVTGKLISVEQHPNANKLLICQVDVGSNLLTIVTGADNVAAGQVVPVGVVGTKLPDGTVLNAVDFRGVASYGMLLSADEMAFDKKTVPTHQRDGIYILPADTPVGRDVVEVLGLCDVQFELDLTPNRADCLSMLGVAWDAAALTNGHIKLPASTKLNEPQASSPELKVTVQDPLLCPGYLGLVVDDVVVGESPLWLQNALRSVGLRPINNIVDITNYVMWELGQPLHAFDYDKLKGQQIVVRKSSANESIVTLDGEERILPEGTLVIADEASPVAIAGIMGGLHSEVTTETKRIVLESALFDLVSIRRSSRLIGLRSDASARFDKGIDPAGVYMALERVAYLLEQLGCGKVYSHPVGVVPSFKPTIEIELRPERANNLLGTDLSSQQMFDILTRLGFTVATKADRLTVSVPSRRRDIVQEVDLVEEVGRVYGLANIPTLPMTGALTQGVLTERQKQLRTIREKLVGSGLNEIMTLSFYDPSFKEKLGLADDHPWSTAILLQNPLSRERSALRPSLVPGMIEVLMHNQARQITGLAAFEIGKAFAADVVPLTKQPNESLNLCLGAYGVNRGNWVSKAQELDFYYLKGFVEMLVPEVVFKPSTHVFLHPGRQADVLVKNKIVGFIGEVHPRVGLRERTVVAELGIIESVALDYAKPNYLGTRRFMPVERDMAFVVESTVAAADVMKRIETAGGELLQSVTLFDVYAGKNLPPGMISLAFRLDFSKQSGTLNETELSEVISAIRQEVESAFKAQLRA